MMLLNKSNSILNLYVLLKGWILFFIIRAIRHKSFVVAEFWGWPELFRDRFDEIFEYFGLVMARI